MHSNNGIKKILRFWAGNNLPDVHIFNSVLENTYTGFLRRWVIHPLKRRIAKYYLILLKKLFGVKVIGITGSAGKTTTKEMLASILELDGKTICSYANIDPVYNIPNTILRCPPSTKYLILEMGVEYPGEMDFYLWLAKPNVGIITNISQTHTEYFGDIDGVLREKKKLAECLGIGSVVINYEDKFLRRLGKSLVAKIFYFGNGTDIMCSRVKIIKSKGTKFLLIFDQDTEKRIWVTIPIVGIQFVYDALAASGAAKSLGISLGVIKKGLENFIPQEHRMNIIKLKAGATIIDDAYNNNPKAAVEAIKTFNSIAGDKSKIVVFGDMLELGKLEKNYHEKIGRELAKSGLSRLICVGISIKYTAEAASQIMGKYHIDIVEKVDDVLDILKPYLTKDSIVLIKGSRSINLDKLVSQLSAAR